MLQFALEHVPQKWEPVLRKRTCSNKELASRKSGRLRAVREAAGAHDECCGQQSRLRRASLAAPTAAASSMGSTRGTPSIRSRIVRHAAFFAPPLTVRIDVTIEPPISISR